RFRRFALWRMARIWQQRDFDRAVAFFLCDLDLLHGAVLVVRALHDKYGYADIGEKFRDIPLAEVGIEPGALPSLERIVDIRMPSRETRAQVAGLKCFLRFDDRGDARIFREEMRSNQDKSTDAVILMAARINGRDRGPVAVAYQEAALEADRIEQARQRRARLVVHIGQRPRQRDGR